MSPVKPTRASVSSSSKVVQFFEIKQWIFDYHLCSTETEFQFNSSMLNLEGEILLRFYISIAADTHYVKSPYFVQKNRFQTNQNSIYPNL